MPSKTSKTHMKAPCEVCTTRKLSKKSSLYKLHSGDTHLRTYLPVDATVKPAKGREQVMLEGLKPNHVIFYFATNTRASRVMDFVETATSTTPFAQAYDKLQNSGVVKTNTKGEAIVQVDCPQVYLAEDGQVYSRHFHIIYWLEKQKKWDTKIYTHQIFCNVDKKFVSSIVSNPKFSEKVLIIDALDKSYYLENHIPGAINLPASQKWSLATVSKKLPKGTNSTTPMILYCYSPECNAAEKLWMQLNKLGFYNTMHYTGGISNWLSSKS